MAKAYCTVTLKALAYVEKTVEVEIGYNPEEHADGDIQNFAEDKALSEESNVFGVWTVTDLMGRDAMEINNTSIDYKEEE